MMRRAFLFAQWSLISHTEAQQQYNTREASSLRRLGARGVQGCPGLLCTAQETNEEE